MACLTPLPGQPSANRLILTGCGTRSPVSGSSLYLCYMIWSRHWLREVRESIQFWADCVTLSIAGSPAILESPKSHRRI